MERLLKYFACRGRKPERSRYFVSVFAFSSCQGDALQFLLEISQTWEFRFRRTGADLQVNEVRFCEGKTELVADFLGFGARCDEVAGLIDQLGI